MKICVLSRGPTLYSTSRIAHAGRKRQHDVRIVDPYNALVGAVGQKLSLSHPIVDMHSFDVVVPRVGASTMPFGLPIVEQFELLGIPVLNNADAFQLSRNKILAGQLLCAEGLSVPDTAVLRHADQIDFAIELLGGPPIVVKLQPGTQGVGVAICETTRSVRSTVEAFWSLGREVILQEFIAEASGTDVRMFVVDGEVVGAMRRTAPSSEFRSNLHRGGTAEAVEVSDAMRDVGVRAADAMDLLVAGVDVLESDRGPLVMEVNPSPGLQGIEEATRVDIAARIIQCAERLAS